MVIYSRKHNIEYYGNTLMIGLQTLGLSSEKFNSKVLNIENILNKYNTIFF